MGRRVAYTRRFTRYDHMDVRFEKSAGRVLSFSVNYRAEIEESWHEVIRYDTHHGLLHVHRFWRGKRRQVEYLEPAEGQRQDYATALAEAEADIQHHWREYRGHLLGHLRR